MTATKTWWMATLACSVLAGCVNDDVGSPGSVGSPQPERLSGDWDEARATSVQPCGPATVETCSAATLGVCGVVDLPDEGGTCLPLFTWGVTPTGAVQFGSTVRLFTLADLASAPLSAAEIAESLEMASLIESSALESADDPLPLAAIDHGAGATSCRTYDYCPNQYAYRDFITHYNSGNGYHYHVSDKYGNASVPWYYCNARGGYQGSSTFTCGTW